MRILMVMAALCVAGRASADDEPGRVRFGLQAAFATEQGNLFGSGESSRTQLAMLQPQMSVAVMRSAGKPQVEIVTEYTAALSMRPIRGKFLHFVNVGGRFHIRSTRPVGGYLEMGAGIGDSTLFTDPADPVPRKNPVFRQLSGHLQYHLQVGGGLRWDVGASRILAGYRLTHLSNKGAQLPNPGLNAHTLVLNYQFRPF